MNGDMNDDVKYVLLTEDSIKQRVAELGKAITEDLKGERPLLICILKGSAVFFADLIREINLPLDIDFMRASSYGSATVSSGKVKVVGALDDVIKDRHVILVEDIIDSGRTIAYIKEDMLGKGVKSLRVCSLLDKPERRIADVSADYVGFVIPDEFVVGYGLDYAQTYRNLKYIGVLKPEVYGA